MQLHIFSSTESSKELEVKTYTFLKMIENHQDCKIMHICNLLGHIWTLEHRIGLDRINFYSM